MRASVHGDSQQCFYEAMMTQPWMKMLYRSIDAQWIVQFRIKRPWDEVQVLRRDV